MTSSTTTGHPAAYLADAALGDTVSFTHDGRHYDGRIWAHDTLGDTPDPMVRFILSGHVAHGPFTLRADMAVHLVKGEGNPIGAFVIRAQQHENHVTGLLYWNRATIAWGGYEHATRYDTADLVLPAGPVASSKVEVVEPYPLDLDGFPYQVDGILGAVRMTHCCGAATSVDDSGFYCKSCYEPTEFTYELPAHLTDRPAAR